MKIENDKYYTPIDLSKYCIDKTYEVIGKDNVTEAIEPSAGNGSFSNQIECMAYDIEPENENIIKQNFLELDLGYKKGRLIIGNPPYGNRNALIIKFFKKSIQIADFIAFILPISQLDNIERMYEFDLIYSEDLGLKEYSNIKLHCCFNMYRRNPKGLNKKMNYKLNDIEIIEYRRNVIKSPELYIKADIGICGYGSGIIGRIPSHLGQYVKEFYFVIRNEKYKTDILNLIKNTNWEKEVCLGISGQLKLAQWQIYKYLKEQIPQIS